MNANRIRQSIEAKYAVDAEGIIRSPGKFKGQHCGTPYFYNLALMGFALHTYGDQTAIIHLSDAEAKAFNLGEATYAAVHEDKEGNVRVDYLR